MNILYVSHSKIPSRFANSVHVMKMCQAFGKNGHKVALLAKCGEFDAGNDYEYYGVERNFELKKFQLLKQPVLGALSYLFKIIGYLRKCEPPDLFYSRYIYGMIGLVGARKPIIFEAHDAPHNFLEHCIFKWLFRHPQFLRLVAISRKLADKYQELYALPASRIVVAHDGADVVDVSQLHPDYAIQWPGRPNCLKVGYLGSLYRGRGIELILRLARQMPKHDFHIIGGSPSQVETLRKESGDIPNLYFHGYIKPSLGPAYRARIDVLLAPYQRTVAVGGNKGDTGQWMSPLKIFEYMASARAIVASRLPTIEEVLEDGRDALLVGPEDIAQWKNAITRLEDGNVRSQLGANARAKLECFYSWDTRARHILAGTQA